MSFVFPMALVLFVPLCGLLVLARQTRSRAVSRLPGAWHGLIVPDLRSFTALRSNLGQAAMPILCFVVALLVVISLARPGLDLENDEAFGTLAGRVVILDVGSDLTRHRHVVDDLYRADPGVSTAVVAVSGDAYRIVPFTIDKAQIDRYLRVLTSEMMPQHGQNAHLGLALAEKMLADAGFPVRQIVLLSTRAAPEVLVEIPLADSARIVIPLAPGGDWSDWTIAQGGTVVSDQALPGLTISLRAEASEIARAELPTARQELTTWLVGLAAMLWLVLFRRRTS
ncbi:MAG: VWA domain-containing protein [Pseudomonadota bacterium]